MIETSKQQRALFLTLDKLRLLVAAEIIRNGLNTSGGSLNISGCADIAELCDQYCLKIFFFWLATKYGLSLYKAAIQKEAAGRSFADDAATLPGFWQPFSDRYPFYSSFDPQTEAKLIQCANAFLDEHFEASADSAGYLYLRSLIAPLAINEDQNPYIAPPPKRRIGGEFYTHFKEVEYCLAQTGWANGELDLLDPACGSGNFLLGAMQMAREPLAAAKRLHGWDIDGKAIAVAQATLYLSGGRALQNDRHKAQIKLTGQLSELASTLFANLKVKDATLALGAERQFDLVVTNPPYVSFGARNQPQLPPSHDSYLRREFPALSQYKIRLHSIFQDLCLRLSKDGGETVLLLPDAFLTGAYYERLRRIITECADVAGLTQLPESTFADATAGRWCVAHYRKRRADDRSPHTVSLRRFDRDRSMHAFEITGDQFVCRDKHRFRLVFNQLDLEIWQKLDGLAEIRTRFRGHTGLRARHGQNSIVANRQKGPSWHRGIISGSQVKPHEVSWSGHWLHIEKSLLYAGGFADGIIAASKVLVRQTGDRLIGAIDAGGLYHLNNVHAFAPLAGASLVDCALFCGLANSNLFRYFYQLKSGETGRALAQVDIEMVESMPLPAKNAQLESAISQLALRLRQHPDAEAVNAIDRLVYDWYQLDTKHIDHIESATNSQDPALPLPSSDRALNLLHSSGAEKKSDVRSLTRRDSRC